MNKDQIAIYINEHPEFFNEYPELLRKIKAIDESDLPIEPLNTLSIADRIIKRVHDDKAHLKNKLEWFVEVAEANEKIHEHLYEIERAILSTVHLDEMVEQLKVEITRRFEIIAVRIYLADGADHFMEYKLKESYPGGINGTLRFFDKNAAADLFNGELKPILHGEVKGDSKVFVEAEEKEAIKSEALIPIILGGEAVGVIGLGSARENHFYDGLRTDYLERMAEKIGIAMGNILLIDRLRRKQTVTDKQTGLYASSYLEPSLQREFEIATTQGKPLSCLKLHIDYFLSLLESFGEAEGEKILQDFAKILTEKCKSYGIVFRIDIGEFIVLLPGADAEAAQKFAETVRSALGPLRYPHLKGYEFPTISVGIATFPHSEMKAPNDLILLASKGLADALEEGGNRLILAATG
ncbi:MAG: DUF484 family protein [Candidatus Nitrohelix vancouverensis]|uniref:DUF484 family protein n=1 Tax=Candidatus Nitrohelix vancouverensis TaxID=2705534 RepID=A0A7T0C0Y5_9BACT|nr:MAG: DUF484 family protein [Candidatus Nitrohelix vancouverensis]